MLYFASGMTKEISTEEKFAALLERIGYLQNEIDRAWPSMKTQRIARTAVSHHQVIFLSNKGLKT